MLNHTYISKASTPRQGGWPFVEVIFFTEIQKHLLKTPEMNHVASQTGMPNNYLQMEIHFL